MDEKKKAIYSELKKWQQEMMAKPSFTNRLAKKVQGKINSIIPEKIHNGISTAIKQMVRAVLFGAEYTTAALPPPAENIGDTEIKVLDRIEIYKNTAAAEGGIAGSGGFLLALAEFPVLLGTKMKMLFDIANLYGYDVKNYKERLYLLHIFQLSFSSQQRTTEVYQQMVNWKDKASQLPDDINAFDWRNFQQEYRDYIDLAKMAQLIPVIGAAVGVVVNYRLIRKLGITAMNAYRMRLIDDGKL